MESDIQALVDVVQELWRLRRAIRVHRDVRGHDRCWLNDLELYRALGEEPPASGLALPPRDDFLRSCARYWEWRQCPEDRRR